MTNYIRTLNYLILFSCLSEGEGEGYNLSENPRRTTKYRRQTICAEYEFRCDNEVCISDTNLCDGIAQCENGSDETKEQCDRIQCPPFTFRCAYGACINKNDKCNGVQNCVDNSDEIDCMASPTPTPTFFIPFKRWASQAPKSEPGDCILPEHLENGAWTIVGQTGQTPGAFVKSNTILQFKCKPKYKLYPEVQGFKLYRMCKVGNWDEEFPKCIKTCNSIRTNEKMIAECHFNNSETNCTNPYDGTIATISCRDLYKDHTLDGRPQRICNDGYWDYTLPTCEPDCGHISITPTALINGGKITEKAEYPWQVAIYLNKNQICGGSIISAQVILTAAHCFETTHWNEYQIVAGKLYRTFDHPNDTEAQYRDVLDVKIQQEFHDGPYLAFDIALVILQKRLHLTKFIRPICIDLTNSLDSSLANAEGVITGWGYTKEAGDSSEILKQLQVKYYTSKDCQATLPVDFRTYYTPYVPDKICAGVFNSSQSACVGDSGGPLAFRKQDGRFYVKGVISVGPFKFNAACDSSKLTLYTSVRFHRDFILQELIKYNTMLQNTFECHDGHQNISKTEMCDGIPQCQDESDEIIEQCGNLQCAENNFRCTYGACINKELMCNGIKDCADNSDEKDCVENSTLKIGSGVCRLPNYPENGKWSIAWLEKDGLTPGSEQDAQEGTLLKFECENGYKLYPENNLYVECVNSKWKFMPECRKTCESRISTTGLRIKCSLNGRNASCVNPYIGTKATMECATFYKDTSVVERPIHHCLNNGKWDYPIPICEPECGHTSIEAQPLIVGGTFTKTGDYPWQVAIYLEEEQICGGSIILQKVILSAAHCFEHIKEPSRYKVGAGKLYRAFNDSRDIYAQYSNVEKIDINGNYDEHYRGDIAALILETPFEITKYVRPICFNPDEINEDELLKDKIGIVTGWGYTSVNSPSDVLKELNVNYFQRQQCKVHIPSEFYLYYSFDKICTGVAGKNMSACRGDSGGSLAIRHRDLYYIRGILSVGPSIANMHCDSSSLSLYTSIIFYRDYINGFIRKYKL